MTTRDKGHMATTRRQFSLQAQAFAASPSLHADALLSALVEAGAPGPEDAMLDVACGPGSVVAAFAPLVRSAVGVDATAAMLDEARALEHKRELTNVNWRLGDVYSLPDDDGSFDIVVCRFAFHHFARPDKAFAEMLRVAKPGARIVLCDAIASDDAAKAAELNEMERLRDPSTVAFQTLAFLEQLFLDNNLGPPAIWRTVHRTTASRLIDNSFPADADRAKLRELLLSATDGDRFGLNAHWEDQELILEAPVVILSARRGID